MKAWFPVWGRPVFVSQVPFDDALCGPSPPASSIPSDLSTQDSHEDHDTSTENADESNHDPQFEPIVSLPEQEIKTLEEDEEELFKM